MPDPPRRRRRQRARRRRAGAFTAATSRITGGCWRRQKPIRCSPRSSRHTAASSAERARSRRGLAPAGCCRAPGSQHAVRRLRDHRRGRKRAGGARPVPRARQPGRLRPRRGEDRARRQGPRRAFDPRPEFFGSTGCGAASAGTRSTPCISPDTRCGTTSTRPTCSRAPTSRCAPAIRGTRTAAPGAASRSSSPRSFDTHSREQTFYFDERGVLRRHDYVAEVVGGWAHGAHYCADHVEAGGLEVSDPALGAPDQSREPLAAVPDDGLDRARRRPGDVAHIGAATPASSVMATMATKPVLWHIPVSHYNEKARWALDYKGVEHERHAPPPPLHMAVSAVAHARGSYTASCSGSTGGRTATRPRSSRRSRATRSPLYPEDPAERRRALEIEDFIDEEVARYMRVLAWHEAIKDLENFGEFRSRDPAAGVSEGTRPLDRRALRGLVSQDALRKWGTPAPPSWLASASRWASTASSRSSATASTSSATPSPSPTSPRRRSTTPVRAPSRGPSLPDRLPGLAREIPAHVDRPAFAWVAEMFARHRMRAPVRVAA